MKKALRLLVIISVVMTLMVMTVSIASAHEPGSENAPTQNPDALQGAKLNSNGANGNGIAQQVPHNPTCGGHPTNGIHPPDGV